MPLSRSSLLVLLALSACSTRSAGISAAPSPPPCPLTNVDETFDSLDAMPAEIGKDLVSRFSDVTVLTGGTGIARRDEFYYVGDVKFASLSGPDRRFVQGARRGQRFVLLYEHGGVGHHDHVVVYERGTDVPLHAAVNATANPRERCDIAQRALDDPADRSLRSDRRDW
ncbi:MAG TPA: hypothetical protein VGO34_10445 [Alphaproteobacteria bacterium]|jgi:hypothetical protein